MKKLLIPLLPVILLSGVLSVDATAQNSNTPQTSSGFVGLGASNSKSPDVAVTAVIKDIVAEHTPGFPTGLHLMLNTPQGVLDASVGPYLTSDIRQALNAGQLVKVVGQIKVIGDQQVLFVRDVVLNGNQITIRNDNGALVRQRSHDRTHTQSSLNDQNGGIQ
jgi:hypothetical protein